MKKKIKSLGGLLKDEHGFVSKETVLKLGLSTVVGLGMVGTLADVASSSSPYKDAKHITHTNVVLTAWDQMKKGYPVTIPHNCARHTNVTTHTSY